MSFLQMTSSSCILQMLMLYIVIAAYISGVHAQPPTPSPTSSSPDYNLNRYNYYLYLVSGIFWIAWIAALASFAVTNFRKKRWPQFFINLCFMISSTLRDCFYWGLFYLHERNRNSGHYFDDVQMAFMDNRLYLGLLVSLFQLLGVSLLMYSWIKFLFMSNDATRINYCNSGDTDDSIDFFRKQFTSKGVEDGPAIKYKSERLNKVYVGMLTTLVSLNVALWIYVAVRTTQYSAFSYNKDNFFQDDMILTSVISLLESILMVIISVWLANALFADIISNPITNDQAYTTYFQSYHDDMNNNKSNKIKSIWYNIKFFYALTFNRSRIAPNVLESERKVLFSVFSVSIIINIIFVIRMCASTFIFYFVTETEYNHHYDIVLVVPNFGYNLCYPWLTFELPELVVSGLINVFISPHEGFYWKYVYPFCKKYLCCYWKYVCCWDSASADNDTKSKFEFNSTLNNLLLTTIGNGNNVDIEIVVDESQQDDRGTTGSERMSEMYLHSLTAQDKHKIFHGKDLNRIEMPSVANK